MKAETVHRGHHRFLRFNAGKHPSKQGERILVVGIGSGGWSYTSLHDFTGGSDGGDPRGGIISGGNGNLYGTTSLGGAYGYGVVWEIAPSLKSSGVAQSASWMGCRLLRSHHHRLWFGTPAERKTGV